MKRIAASLALMASCVPSAAYRASTGAPTTTILRLTSPDEQEAPTPPPNTKPQEVPQTTPSRPAQREVSPPPSTILELTTTIPLQSDLLDCLKRWESGNGATSDNLYQFDQATWEAAGGTGTPDNASTAKQDAVAQNWINKGHLRQAWAAQRGRCF